MTDNGMVRDVLYEFINHLEQLHVKAGYGTWLKNDDEIFFENCIEVVEDYIEAFEDDV